MKDGDGYRMWYGGCHLGILFDVADAAATMEPNPSHLTSKGAAMKSIGFLLLVATAILLSLGMIGEADDLNPAAASSPRQGLLGHYYTPHLGDKNDFRGLVEDRYGVSVPAVGKQPDTVRVDSQIAFGKGVGFSAPRDARVSPVHASQVVWWPEELADGRPGNAAGAVIWKGYLRLPEAGTYFLATATHGATAVYLNQGRVALKGARPSSGTIQSDAFSYPETETGEPAQQPRSQYLVPITIDSPRDFPLEVRYRPRHNRPVGIDLYWVTPDSPLDEEGKPIASIVPAEVLFVDPPGQIDAGVTRSESSMISSEFLYFSPATQGDDFTLTIRLADEKGRPVPGKRVHVSGLVSSKQADIIIQPENATDENGVTTARVRAGPGYRARHESTFHAADVTDFVDVGQVAHVQFDNTRPSFLPQTYAPYYDDKQFLVEPLPLTIGRPVTIKVPLTNHTEADAELTVIFQSNELNIGAKEWPEIGRVSRIRLEPGESTEASIEWTPRDRKGKRCFRVHLSAEFPQRSVPGQRAGFGLFPLASLVAVAQAEGEKTTVTESLQRNIGLVSKPILDWAHGVTSLFPPGVPIPTGEEDARRHVEAQEGFTRFEQMQHANKARNAGDIEEYHRIKGLTHAQHIKEFHPKAAR